MLQKCSLTKGFLGGNLSLIGEIDHGSVLSAPYHGEHYQIVLNSLVLNCEVRTNRGAL